MKTIYVIPKNCIRKIQIISLISYLANDSSKTSITIKVGINKYDEITNNSDTYIIFSLFDTSDIVVFNKLINDIRVEIQNIKFNIVVGGVLLDYIDLADFKKAYYEVTHICIGKGEAFFKKLIIDGLEHGTYYADEFGKIQHYQYNDNLLEWVKEGHITFIDNRCSWNKCTFCHHTTSKYLRKINTAEQVVEDVHKYKIDNDISTFYIYDNELLMDNLIQFLELLRRKKYHKGLNFKIFGMRISNNYDELTKVLSHWNYNPIQEISWGVEFFDDEILDLYNKGITTAQIVDSLKYFHNIGTKNYAYLLLGLPLVRNKNISNLLTLHEKYHFLIDEYRTSFFRLSNKIEIYKDQEKYKIRPIGHYSIGDLLNNYDLPHIKTAYIKFDSWDIDDNRWKDRGEILEKYIAMKSTFGLSANTMVIKNI